MSRCALFVDAGYALADGAMAVHGTRRQDSVSWDHAGLIKLLTGIAKDRTGLPVLRCYWYETAVDGHRSPEQDALAETPGLKLRLASTRPGRREGVEALLRRDLSTLAKNGAISEAVVASADEGLAEVVAEVQELGLRVMVLHISSDSGWTVPQSLRQESDDIAEISAVHLRPFVELVRGAEPASTYEQFGIGSSGLGGLPAVNTARPGTHHAQSPALSAPGSGYAVPTGDYLQPIAGGHGQGVHGSGNPRLGGAGGQALNGVSQMPQDAAASNGAQRSDAYQNSAGQNSAGQNSAGQYGVPQNGSGQYGVAPSGTGQFGAAASGGYQNGVGQYGAGQSGGGQNGAHRDAAPQNGGGQFQPLPPDGLPQNGAGGPAQVGYANGAEAIGNGKHSSWQSGATQAGAVPYALPGNAQPETGSGPNGPALNGAAGGQNGSQRSIAGYQESGAASSDQQRYLGYQPGTGSAGYAAAPVASQPQQSYADPGAAYPAGPQQALTGPVSGAAGAPVTGESFGGGTYHAGSYLGPAQQASGNQFQQAGQLPQQGQYQQQGQFPAGSQLPLGNRAEQPGQSFQSGGQFRPPGQLPPGGQVQPAGQLPPGGQVQQSGQLERVAQAPVARIQQASLPLPEAVKAAHAEGFGFGESVGRDAPALWLDAVLARKPRMPSDLEARLLQGSALPIDSLLHDEVRHSLRRGFWDALETARR